jgi:protein-tyrosine phosphatase
MSKVFIGVSGFVAAFLAVSAGATTPISDAKVERISPDHVTVSWVASGPVDVYVSDKPDAMVRTAKLTSSADPDGRYDSADNGNGRAYFLLRDRKTGATIRTAERLLPLVQGSNFRDVGGYETIGGKHVRWGLIYRSGATPMLTETDVARVKALGLHDMVDLRSSEERLLAPTKLTGIRYTAIDYPMMGMMAKSPVAAAGYSYANYPEFFAPHLRAIFEDLLRKQGPVLYHCTAGQDRTGFTTAIILTALGVPRDTIVADYHLSTKYRQPQWEMDKIDPALAASNSVAALFAGYQKNGAFTKAQPLKTADGKPYLDSAFSEIETRWGSVEGYLTQEIGLSKSDLKLLRVTYLE